MFTAAIKLNSSQDLNFTPIFSSEVRVLPTKKIVVSVADNLLSEVELLMNEEHKNRSEFINDAIQFYLGECRRQSLRQKLTQGYVEMGEINLYMSCEVWDE